MMSSAARFSVALLFAFPSFAADLELRYGAMERLIAEQLFTQDGRRYVRGNALAKCQYAFLEAPHIRFDYPIASRGFEECNVNAQLLRQFSRARSPMPAGGIRCCIMPRSSCF